MKKPRSFLMGLLRSGVVLLTLVPLGYALYKQWVEVSQLLASIRWWQAAWGTLLMMAAQPLMGLIAWVVLFFLDARRPYLKVLALYFVSQVAKYLPGGIWAFPGRMVAYQAVGVNRAAAVVSVAREVAALYLGASLVGLLGLFAGLPVSTVLRVTIGMGVIICFLAVVVIQVPASWQLFGKIRFLRKFAESFQALQTPGTTFRWFLPALLVSAAFWLAAGLAFRELAASVSPSASNLTWLQAAGVFSLSWCAGFVVVFAPAGLGVREATLSLLLGSFIPSGEAIAIALLARLWWTAAEALYILVSVIWMSRTASLAALKNPQLAENRG
jgi:uncharacterized membrane protein YbhN (UPF0104 family)